MRQDPQSAIRGEARWLSAAVFALLATVAVCYPAWPGLMNYDGLYAYGSAVLGVRSMVWPPMHAYLFWLSRSAGLGSGGLFAFQTFAIFFGVALSTGLLVAGRRQAWAAMLGFAVLAVVVTPLLGVMLVQWRDVATASFAMLGLAFWLLAARTRSLAWLAPAAIAAGLSVSLRYNAFPLFLLSAPLMVWRPFLDKPANGRARAVVALALAASLALAWASTVWRLPDLRRLPPAQTLASIQLFDLLGVSACAGESFVPPAVSQGARLTGAQVRALYDARHLQLAFRPHPGAPRLYATQKYMTPQMRGEIRRAWLTAVQRHLGCYLAHRNAVFAHQLGITQAFAPTYGEIDPNPFGLRLARPRAAAAMTSFVVRGADRPWSRPVLLFLGAAAVTGALAARRDPRAMLAVALLGGALANAALLYLIGPASDARYIFPSNVLCAFLIAAGAAMLGEGVRGRPR